MEESPVGQLARALQFSEQLVAGVGPEQWAAATPCSRWTVHDLVTHLVVGNRLIANALRGEPPADPESSAHDVVAMAPGELVGAYRASVCSVLEAFALPGALGRMVTVPFGTVPGIVALHLRMTEALVHSWDLARATGLEAGFPDDLAEQELTFTGAKLADVAPGRSPFGPPQPVADDAPAIDRLAALLGRPVTAGTAPAPPPESDRG